MSDNFNIESQHHGMGCIPSKHDIRDYKLNKKVCFTTNLPDAFQVEHSAIKDQGAVGSCVAHSVSEVLEQLESGKINYSTAWIYGYRPFGYYQGQGMMTSDAMKTVAQVGAVQFIDCPGNIELPQAKKLVDADLSRLKELAQKDKIASYARLRTLQEIKEAIYKTGKPVVVCIVCDDIKLDKHYIAQIPEQGATGGHAVVCYGWNELGLLIQNSWGTWWGNKGCFILPYEYPITESWVMTKDPDVVIKPSAFELREFLVNLFRLISLFLSGLFKKK